MYTNISLQITGPYRQRVNIATITYPELADDWEISQASSWQGDKDYLAWRLQFDVHVIGLVFIKA